MKILAIDPYLARSHESFLQGLIKHSSHEIDVISMPPQKWKWRMRTSGITIGKSLFDQSTKFKGPYQAILATDFLPLADFRATAPESVARLPVIYYFHENQLTYPVQKEDERDFHFAFTNIASAILADKVLFNTEFHKREFLGAAARFVKLIPGKDFDDSIQHIDSKSGVLPVGINMDDFHNIEKTRLKAPLILWNHRWEYDKNPDEFFLALRTLKSRGMDFRLAVLGESFRSHPPVFDLAKTEFQNETIRFGFVESRLEYLKILASADIVVSTAIHEFFGLAVIEAMAAGSAPLLPNRLSYPEILPKCLHKDHLYEKGELPDKLERIVLSAPSLDGSAFTHAASRFDWKHTANLFDHHVETLASAH